MSVITPIEDRPEIVQQICDLMSEGMSLRKACIEVGVTRPTFLRWMDEDSALADQYARARSVGIDAEFERLEELQQEQPERGPTGGVDSGWVAWRRLQIDAKRWQLSKQAPKKYGDKIDVAHSGGLRFTSIETVIVDPAG